MRKFLKPVLAVISGIAIYFAVAYLLLMVDQQLAFLGIVTIPFLAGVVFKVKEDRSWLTYPLCISIPPIIGFGFFWYLSSSSNVGLLFMPLVAGSAFLGSYLRNYVDTIYRKKTGMIAGSYVLICVLIGLTVMPNMKLLDFTERVNEPVPAVELMTLDKQTTPVSELEGKIIVMDFWATWCGPCLQLMPELERLDKKYDDNPDVVVKAVNTSWKNSLEDVQNFLEENPKDVDVLYDKDGRLTEKLGIDGIPHTVIIDNEAGKLRVRKSGFTPSQDYVGTMSEHIERLLDEQET